MIRISSAGFVSNAVKLAAAVFVLAVSSSAPADHGGSTHIVIGLDVPATSSTGDYDVSWNNSTGRTYELWQSIDGGFYSLEYTGTGTSIPYSGIADGTYKYRIRWWFCMWSCSYWYTEPVTVVVALAPPAPTGLTGPATDSDGFYTISWAASAGSTSYKLEENPGTGTWNEIYSGSLLSEDVTGNLTGTYSYRVAGCDANALCSDWSTEHVVNVTIPPAGVAAPPAAAVHGDPGASLSSDQTGTTAGNFRVDESGAATYSIPIATAAGTAGVAPQITLNYSSSAGNGIAGQGWSVGGLSAITRCRQTYNQDRDAKPIGWNLDDRYCLDGQRLVLHPLTQTYGVLDTTYRTEIDSGAIVTIKAIVGGEPDYFEVNRKDGSTSYYGKSPVAPADVTAKNGDGAGKTLSWAIRHFEDSIGNPIWFSYIDNGLGHRVDQIRWGFGLGRGPIVGSSARLQFVYDVRDDKKSGYVAGSVFENESRLIAIESFNTVVSESMIRHYALGYNEGISASDKLSRLTSVEECVGTTCLPKTTFDWRVPNNNINGATTTTFSIGGNDLAGFRPADINGDGRMDLVWLEGTGTSKTIKYAISDGTQYVAQTFSSGNAGESVNVDATEPSFQAIDYNLDGRQDIAYFDTSASVWKIFVAEPFSDGQWRLNSTTQSTSLTVEAVAFVDVDSNGTTDALYPNMRMRHLEPNPAEPGPSSSTWYHFGDEVILGGVNLDVLEFAQSAPDFDGDGKVDYVFAGVDIQCYEPGEVCQEELRAIASTGFTFYFPTENSGGLLHPQIDTVQTVDVNADGLTDIFYGLAPGVEEPNSGEVSEYRLQISMGNGQFASMPITDATLTNDVANPQFVDWNMDGHPDLLWKESTGGGNVKARYWNPDINGLDSPVVVFTSPTNSNIEFISYFDINGDAAPDLVRINANGTVGSLAVDIRQTGGVVSNVAVNRIEAFTNGLGAVTSVTYEPLSYSSHYERLQVATTPGTATVCDFPGDPYLEFCFDKPIQVASPASFYEAINGDWDYPGSWQGLSKNPPTLERNAPVLELSGPMYVVTNVVGDAPVASASPGNVNVNGTSSISYYYGEAKIQAAGRGFLGFQQLTTVDDQSGVKTITSYRQDWPFIGSPVGTLVSSQQGNTLSTSSTVWEILEWVDVTTENTVSEEGTAAIGSIHVMQVQSQYRNYSLVSDGAGAGTHLSTLTTENGYDIEANADWIKVTTTNAVTQVAEQVVTTVNAFDQATFSLWDGRLMNTTVTTTRAGLAGGVTRESSFEYYTSGIHTGMLSKEIVEPYQSAYTLETAHSYDTHGNRNKSKTTGGSETRCDDIAAVYDSTGRYVDQSYDCLGRLTSEVISRNAFGSPTQVDAIIDAVDTNSRVSTRIYYGALGREYFRTSDDGSFAKTYLSTNSGNCPSGTAYRSTSYAAGGGSAEVCYDVLARETRKMTLGFDGQWDAQDTEYDSSGRVLHKSEPFDLGSGSPFWTEMTYDLFGRVIRVDLPADNGEASWSTTGYQNFDTIVKNAKNQIRTETRNALGEITKVKDNLGGTTNFAFDHLGNLSTVTDNAGNQTVTTFNDLGQKISMNDPDKGDWSYEYTAFGELSKQTNANLQTSEMTYDGVGRMATRVDKLQNGTVEGSTVWAYDSSPDGLGRLDNVRDTYSGHMKSVLYDSLGRVDEVITNFDAGLYYEKTTYDQFGRPFQAFDAAGDGSFTDHAIVSQYNSYGYLESIGDALLVNGVPRTTYRKIVSMTARGQVKQEQLGIDASGVPAVTTTFDFYAATGRMRDIDSINRAGVDVQDLYYDWDALGNLEERRDNSGPGPLIESFGYDGLNRLTSQAATGQTTLAVTYDSQHLGNIKSKTGVSGNYAYGAGAGPHAVTSVAGSTYYYDDNGNNTVGGGRTINYFTFDKPSSISKNGHTTSFEYGPDRSRFRRIDDDGSSTTTTRYIGNVEIISRPNGTKERKRYLAGIAIETGYYTAGTETSRETVYTLKDHLGSMDVLTDSEGGIDQEMSFGAWGQRRNTIDWEELDASNLLIDLGALFDVSKTTRGFTGHEMLDAVGVIHMNGRIYDPFLGRFLQADPFVQDPTNTQSLNRYSYVFNNPLNATDPSGNIALLFAAIALYAGGAGAVQTAIVLAFAGMADALVAGAQGFDVLLAGMSAAAFSYFGGNLFPAGGFGFNAPSAGYVVSIGAIGGITSSLGGGSFGSGFRSAGIGTLVGGIAGNLSKNAGPLRSGITRVVAAGTASALTGGKFVNGAATAAFSAALKSTIEIVNTGLHRVPADLHDVVAQVSEDLGEEWDQSFSSSYVDKELYTDKFTGQNVDSTDGIRTLAKEENGHVTFFRGYNDPSLIAKSELMGSLVITQDSFENGYDDITVVAGPRSISAYTPRQAMQHLVLHEFGAHGLGNDYNSLFDDWMFPPGQLVEMQAEIWTRNKMIELGYTN